MNIYSWLFGNHGKRLDALETRAQLASVDIGGLRDDIKLVRQELNDLVDSEELAATESAINDKLAENKRAIANVGTLLAGISSRQDAIEEWARALTDYLHQRDGSQSAPKCPR